MKPTGALSDEERHRRLNTRLFARATPRQKLGLIELHQRGTRVAREAADMLLQDDAFSTIVAAVRQGRVIFRNIRQFDYYLMSCNVGEVAVVSLATAAGTQLSILPLQIFFLNLVTDVFPALALGVGEGDEGTMRRPPRDPSEPVLSRRHWIGLGLEGEAAVTVSFLTLAIGQLWHVFNMRQPTSGVFSNEVTRNRYVWAAVGVCVLLLFGAVYIPGVGQVLEVQPPSAEAWGIIALMSLVPLGVGQVVLGVRRWRNVLKPRS